MHRLSPCEGNRNTITIQALDTEWAPNFDRITIHPAPSEEGTGIKPTVFNAPKDFHRSDYITPGGRKPASVPAKETYLHDGKKTLRQ